MTTISNLETLKSMGVAIPAYVTDAADTEGLQKIARTGLSTQTKRATYLAAVDIALNPESYPDAYVKQAVDKGIDFWGIRGDVNLALHPVSTASEIQYTKYALEIKENDAVLERRFPLNGSTELRCQAASDLCANRTAYPWPVVKEAAAAILDDGELGFEMTGALEKMAGRGTNSAQALEYAITQRYQKSAAYIEPEITQFAEVLCANESNLTEEVCGKLAAILDVADRKTLRHLDYAKGLCTPEAVCFADTRQKKAADAATEIMLDGEMFKRAAVESISPMAFAEFGDEFVDKISTEDGNLDVAKLAAACGAAPKKKKKAIKACVKGTAC